MRIKAGIFCLLLFNSINVMTLPIRMEIKEGWKFKQARLSNWYPAAVPGVVHTDLIDNKIIEDPFFRLNERDVQWVDKEDWIYETSFDLLNEMKNKNNIRIHFKGLDTYADVYLNDKMILESNNMFREWKIDITNLLKERDNKLKIYFHSPIKKAMPLWEASPIKYRASNDQSENGGIFDRKVSVYTRKAGYHYGWDWGPRLVTSGIWRPITLEAWNEAKIETIQIEQKEVSTKRALLDNKLEILSDKDITNVKVTIADEKSGKELGKTIANLHKGLNSINIPYTIEKPKLWWCNGLGEAHLYNIKTILTAENRVIDSQVNKVGVRSIEVVRQTDEHGIGFYFKVNGIPVFSKGANYIPCDIFLPRVTKDIYKKTVLDAANSNMNMLRVWGGGVYEDDYFYDLCDEYGILVWQDFMFACSVYPSEGDLLENIRQEAIDNVKRIRNHPSLAIWCGNNEIMDALFNWGGGWLNGYKKQSLEYGETVWKQYYDLFHVTLPKVVAEYDPSTYYLPSSPFSDMKGSRNEKVGDYHYWTTWQQGLSISTFNKAKSRYFSEYGFQSFPAFETVKQYAPNPDDWDIYSDVMMWHQRGGVNANKTIEKCIINEYGNAKNFESFLYLSQLLQADAIKIAIEAHRRNMPYCMGSLYWQHNDCWPVASWSSRDYYGRWKAQHYYVRKAFKDVLISPIEENNTLKIYAVSDRLKAFSGKLSVSIMTFDGTEVSKTENKVKIQKNTSTFLYSIDTENLVKGNNKKNIYLYASLVDDKGNTFDNVYFFTLQKDIAFPLARIEKTIEKTSNGFRIKLSSDKFTRGVYLFTENSTCFFEDNFFDILPDKPMFINVNSNLSLSDFEKNFKIISLNKM